jgi:DNA-binding CsgD family transcriptional regulator
MGLLFAALTAALHGSRLDGRYAAFMASFTVIIAMDTARIYISNAGATGGVLDVLLPHIQMAGASLMIAVLPRFCHSFADMPGERTLNIMFIVLAAVSYALDILWACGIPAVFPPAAIPNANLVLLVLVIVYSAAVGNIFGRTRPAREMSDAEAVRWRRMMARVTVLTVSFIPLFVAIDFFPGLFPTLSARLPPSFRTYPFFFLLWNLCYVFNTLPTYGRPAPRSEEQGFGRFSLSPREREVALLLLEGLSYRDIAEKLCVSLATVKTHVNRIYVKTGAGNKMELSRMLRGPDPQA